MTTGRVARSISTRAPDSMSRTASSIENGLTAMSPASATCSAPNGVVSRTGLYGRNNRDDSRTWAGPNRAPGR